MKTALVAIAILLCQAFTFAAQETATQQGGASEPVATEKGAQQNNPAPSVVVEATPGATAPTQNSLRLSTGIPEIIRLVEGGVERSVIEAYIRSSSIAYAPTADEVLYMQEKGVPSELITAMMQRGSELREKWAQLAKANQQRLPNGYGYQNQAATAPAQTMVTNTVVVPTPVYTYAPPVYTYVPYPVYNYTYVTPRYYHRPIGHWHGHHYHHGHHKPAVSANFKYYSPIGSVRYSPYVHRR